MENNLEKPELTNYLLNNYKIEKKVFVKTNICL